MPLDELLAKYQPTDEHAAAADDDAGLLPYSPASLSDTSDTSGGKNFVIFSTCGCVVNAVLV